MEIFHRISVDKEHRPSFLKIGIDLHDYEDQVTKYGSFVVLRVAESEARWPEIQRLTKHLDVLDLTETEFSDQELRQASNLRFLSKSFTGYPEPSDYFGYRDITYDLTDYCEECGIGFRQKAPFRLVAEPKWGRRQTFQLHWVFDEIFVKLETWEKVFKPFGVPSWRVQSRSGKDYESVVQLRVDPVIDLDMHDDLPKQNCPKCHRTKYLPLRRGFWPTPRGANTPIFKSSQYFGDGHTADRDLFVSHNLYLAMTEARLNCRYWACGS